MTRDDSLAFPYKQKTQECYADAKLDLTRATYIALILVIALTKLKSTTGSS